MALVLGVNSMPSPIISKYLAEAGMTSATGRCHAFDTLDDGYIGAEGCGAVFITTLDEAWETDSQIYSVVHGISIGQDGTSTSLTTPNGSAQEKVITSTLCDAGLESSDVSYIEAHGTGTFLGDLIEMDALLNVFKEGRDRKFPLVMGSVTENISHFEAGSGVSGLMKAILVLQHEEAPPNLLLQKINPKIIEVPKTFPVHFLTTLEPLRNRVREPMGKPLIASINSFKFSGTIAHAIISQLPTDLAKPLSINNSNK